MCGLWTGGGGGVQEGSRTVEETTEEWTREGEERECSKAWKAKAGKEPKRKSRGGVETSSELGEGNRSTSRQLMLQRQPE